MRCSRSPTSTRTPGGRRTPSTWCCRWRRRPPRTRTSRSASPRCAAGRAVRRSGDHLPRHDARDPLSAPALNYLGYMLADRGQKLPEALSLIERALKVDPDNPSYLDSQAWTLFKMKRPRGGRAAARQGACDARQLGHPGAPRRGAWPPWGAVTTPPRPGRRSTATGGHRPRRHRERLKALGRTRSDARRCPACPAPAGLVLAAAGLRPAPRRSRRVPAARPPTTRRRQAFPAATAHCAGLRTATTTIRLWAGSDNRRCVPSCSPASRPGLAAFEAVAPFGPPGFILAGTDDRATLVFPREAQVLDGAAVPDVLGALAGLTLAPMTCGGPARLSCGRGARRPPLRRRVDTVEAGPDRGPTCARWRDGRCSPP